MLSLFFCTEGAAPMGGSFAVMRLSQLFQSTARTMTLPVLGAAV